jgi:predicted TIM-barrel fold metal-dependent hydrolase
MMHFPELRVIASPPGWPWVTELIGVAWRHPTVHIGLVALRPKYLAVANSGYEPLLQFGNTLLQERMIFGSLWPMQPIGQAVAEIEALPIKDQTKRKWLHENAARFLRLG